MYVVALGRSCPDVSVRSNSIKLQHRKGVGSVHQGTTAPTKRSVSSRALSLPNSPVARDHPLDGAVSACRTVTVGIDRAHRDRTNRGRDTRSPENKSRDDVCTGKDRSSSGLRHSQRCNQRSPSDPFSTGHMLRSARYRQSSIKFPPVN